MRPIKSIDSDSGRDGNNKTRGEVAMLFDERRNLTEPCSCMLKSFSLSMNELETMLLYLSEIIYFLDFTFLLRTFIRQQHHYQKPKFPPLFGYRET